MQRLPLFVADDYSNAIPATLTNVRLDYTINVSPYGHPAVLARRIPSVWGTPTGAQAVGVTQPAVTNAPTITKTGTSWAAVGNFGVSTTQGDNLSFTTTAYQVFIQLTGRLSAGSGAVAGSGLAANSVRNGALATIVATSATQTYTTVVDTYNAAPLVPLYLDGTSTAVTITYSGHNPALASVTGPDQIMLAVESIAFGSGSGGTGTAQLITPIYDLGDPTSQAVLAEWTQPPWTSPVIGSITASTGSTATPDGSWTRITLPATALGQATMSDGTVYGTAGLMGLGRGRYLQLTITLAGIGAITPWIRDIAIYTWVPERDPLMTRVSLGRDVQAGPVLAAFIATLATHALDRRLDALAFIAAGSVGGATDMYLQGYLTDVGLLQVTGEQPRTAQARARGVLTSLGLTLVSIAQEVAALVTGPNTTALSANLLWPVTLTGLAGSQTAAANGVLVTQTGASAYSVTIPPGPYAGMPGIDVGTARSISTTHIQTTLCPVASTVTVTFT